MNRRDFVSLGLGVSAGGLLIRDAQSFASPEMGDTALYERSASYRLPETDRHYRRVRSYVEETPNPEYRWASSAAYEAFRDLKYGVRLHWGPYSIWRLKHESWPFLEMPFEERQKYQELYRKWNPRGFDADEWMSLFAESGMKMFAFTSKHHDCFSMFETETRVRQRVNWTTPSGPKIEACDLAYSMMETPFRRDVVKELCDAAHKREIKVDLYYSHPDWYDADFRPYVKHPLQTPSAAKLDVVKEPPSEKVRNLQIPAPDPTPEVTRRMLARHRAQLTELLTRYGRIDMLCLDMWLGPMVWPQLRETLLHIRKLQPDVMLRARGIGNYGDYYTPEGFVPGNKENTDLPWFVIYPLATGFSYDEESKNYKGAEWIVRNLVDSVAKGGNFMVAIGPDGDGRFHPTAVAQLKEVGAWLKVNGEGIYATRAREGLLYAEGETIRYTHTKDQRIVYAFSLGWPASILTLKTVRARAGSKVRMLGFEKPLTWRNDGEKGLVIEIPPELQDENRRPCRVAYCFRIEVANQG